MPRWREFFQREIAGFLPSWVPPTLCTAIAVVLLGLVVAGELGTVGAAAAGALMQPAIFTLGILAGEAAERWRARRNAPPGQCRLAWHEANLADSWRCCRCIRAAAHPDDVAKLALDQNTCPKCGHVCCDPRMLATLRELNQASKPRQSMSDFLDIHNPSWRRR